MWYKFMAIFAVGAILWQPSLNAQGIKRINIAHRGACGYLPEHTLQAKAMAFAQNADYIEQDIVLSKDLVPIVVHDIHLDTVSDVAERFPERKRDDGRFYAADLTLAEIKSLKVNERIDLKTGKAVFEKRFPIGKSVFRISTLAEELEMIQGLNKSTGKNIGIYPEVKEPAWHRENGMDISKIVLKTLADYGYSSADSKCFLQCFDAQELKRIKNELKSNLQLIQLMEEEMDLEEVSGYAKGIGPWIGQIVTGKNADGNLELSSLVADAHAKNLLVHPYTFRVDAPIQDLAPEFLLQLLFDKIGIDGIFSDFPDVSGRFLESKFVE